MEFRATRLKCRKTKEKHTQTSFNKFKVDLNRITVHNKGASPFFFLGKANSGIFRIYDNQKSRSVLIATHRERKNIAATACVTVLGNASCESSSDIPSKEISKKRNSFPNLRYKYLNYFLQNCSVRNLPVYYSKM